jgi:hypothetical protein
MPTSPASIGAATRAIPPSALSPDAPAVEALAVAAIDALLALGVDIHRHLRVGAADLAHDPLDVEVVASSAIEM